MTDAAEEKRRMMRDAALITLKRQAEWHDMPAPSVNDIEKRISIVAQYPIEDLQTAAMKELVLTYLECKLEIARLRESPGGIIGWWRKLWL